MGSRVQGGDARCGNASWMPYCARGDAVNTGRFDSVRCIPPESCSPPWRRTALSRSGIALRKDRSPTRAVPCCPILYSAASRSLARVRPAQPHPASPLLTPLHPASPLLTPPHPASPRTALNLSTPLQAGTLSPSALMTKLCNPRVVRRLGRYWAFLRHTQVVARQL